MKHADEAIRKVLTGLRESEAPAGMEDRILQAMQARVAEAADEHSRSRFSAWWLAPYRRLAFAMVLAAFVGGGVMHVTAHRAAMHSGAAAARLADPTQAALPFVPPPDRAAHGGTAGVEQAGIANTTRGRSRTPGIAHADTPDGDRLGALAREEMLAPSHPAPPLPMTAQEKLFRQAVVGEHFDQLAMLNEGERAKAHAKADEEFKSFFGIDVPINQGAPVAPGAADKPAEQKQDEAEPIAASGARQADAGRK